MKNPKIVLLALLTISILLVSAAGCTSTTKTKTLTVFHAGSLAVPFNQTAIAFQNQYPNVTVQLEAAGSVESVKKISELNRTADVVATSDWEPINTYLYKNNLTNWYAKFATNSMVVMYSNSSKYAKEINSTNWYQVLSRADVQVGRANPDIDPNGYRTLMVWKLAEQYYNQPGLYNKLLAQAPDKNVRSKETDLIALVEVGQIDYAWNYKSVALQHNLSYVDLPPQINLSDPQYDSVYNTVSVTSANKTYNGSVIEYGITVPLNAPNPDVAAQFVIFLLGPQGTKIMEDSGQKMLKPVQTVGTIPDWLKPFASPAITNPAVMSVTTRITNASMKGV
jgi:molybdate/tungstate transport system substrate-binding protein